MKIDKHLQFFENVLKSKTFSAEMIQNDEIRIVYDGGFLYLSDDYVRIPLNQPGGVFDDTLVTDTIDKDKITAAVLVSLLKGEQHTRMKITNSDEEYFQMSTLSNNVYPPIATNTIQKLVTRWMEENGHI